MSNKNKAQLEGAFNHNYKSKVKYLWAIAGTIILGAIGSGVWEMIAKPGLSSAGRLFLDFITFGSTRVKDWAYETASFEPYALPALLLFACGFWSFSGFMTIKAGELMMKFIFLHFMKGHAKDSSSTARASDQPPYFISSRLQRFRSQGYVVAIIIPACGFMIGGLVINQAILVKRSFETNMAICGPAMSVPEEKLFRSRYASMRSKDQHAVIISDLEKLCQGRGILLRGFPTW